MAAETSVLAVAALVAGYAGLSRSARMASASIGLAFPTHGTSTEALMLAADAALYSAKAQGRDRTLVHAP